MQESVQTRLASRNAGPIRVVDLGRFRVSHADALREAHASLAAAEANLRALAGAATRPVATSGRSLFRRA